MAYERECTDIHYTFVKVGMDVQTNMDMDQSLNLITKSGGTLNIALKEVIKM